MCLTEKRLLSCHSRKLETSIGPNYQSRTVAAPELINLFSVEHNEKSDMTYGTTADNVHEEYVIYSYIKEGRFYVHRSVDVTAERATDSVFCETGGCIGPS